MPAGPFHACFDFRLRPQIPLAELALADGAAAASPLVEVRLGPVPERLPGVEREGFRLQVAGGEAVARYAPCPNRVTT